MVSKINEERLCLSRKRERFNALLATGKTDSELFC